MQIIHYTSRENLEKIKEIGRLMPRTEPFEALRGIITIPPDVKKMATSKYYLVGIPEKSLDGWVEYGLMSYVLKKTSEGIRLSIPILERDGAFVREHKYMSPKYFTDLYNEDLWKKIWECQISEDEDPRTKDSLIKYIKSATKLNDYKNQFEVPEIWVPQETPIDRIIFSGAPI